MPSIEVGAEVLRNCARNCSPCVRSFCQTAARRHPFSGRDRRRVSNNRDEVLMATRLHPEHAKAVLLVVEGHPFHKAGKNLAPIIVLGHEITGVPLCCSQSSLRAIVGPWPNLREFPAAREPDWICGKQTRPLPPNRKVRGYPSASFWLDERAPCSLPEAYFRARACLSCSSPPSSETARPRCAPLPYPSPTPCTCAQACICPSRGRNRTAVQWLCPTP